MTHPTPFHFARELRKLNPRQLQEITAQLKSNLKCSSECRHDYREPWQQEVCRFWRSVLASVKAEAGRRPRVKP